MENEILEEVKTYPKHWISLLKGFRNCEKCNRKNKWDYCNYLDPKNYIYCVENAIRNNDAAKEFYEVFKGKFTK